VVSLDRQPRSGSHARTCRITKVASTNVEVFNAAWAQMVLHA
jgi:hypothetical protein